MNIVNSFQAIKFLPQALSHLKAVNKSLQNKPYSEVILQEFNLSPNKQNVMIIVKSYFWACRIIPSCHCLPRSIAIYQYLTASGYSVEHRFGVNKAQEHLQAHAWVEMHGKPLNENSNLLKRFKVLQQENKSS